MNKDLPRDLLTQQLLTKASAPPDVKADFTARVLAQIEVKTREQRAKINEPLFPGRAWLWLGIGLSSMVLLVLSVSVLAFGSWPDWSIGNLFNNSLKEALAANSFGYLPQLVLANVICFCWLTLDYLYTRLPQR